MSPTRDQLLGKRLDHAVTDPKSGKVLVKAYPEDRAEVARRIEGLGLPSVTLLRPNRYIEATVDAEPNVDDMEDALSDIYRTIRPGDPSTPESARGLLVEHLLRPAPLRPGARRPLQDEQEAGPQPADGRPPRAGPPRRALGTQADIVPIIKYIIDFSEGEHTRDDIDHLENKRVRSVGELLQNQMRLGLPPHGEGGARAHDGGGRGQRGPAGGALGEADLGRASRASSAAASCRSSWTRRTRWRS